MRSEDQLTYLRPNGHSFKDPEKIKNVDLVEIQEYQVIEDFKMYIRTYVIFV